jgi:carboxymethylenebutenolidase
MTTTNPDLGAAFEEHMRCEFVARDLAATMRTMSAAPRLTHVPTLAGGDGADGVRAFYRDHFIGQWPADTRSIRIARTVGSDRLVDEMVMCFTHDLVMDTFLPGIRPTGRYVELPVVVVVDFRDGQVAEERIYWDQASLLVQVGLLDPALLPVLGREPARRLRGEPQAMNGMLAAENAKSAKANDV